MRNPTLGQALGVPNPTFTVIHFRRSEDSGADAPRAIEGRPTGTRGKARHAPRSEGGEEPPPSSGRADRGPSLPQLRWASPGAKTG